MEMGSEVFKNLQSGPPNIRHQRVTMCLNSRNNFNRNSKLSNSKTLTQNPLNSILITLQLLTLKKCISLNTQKRSGHQCAKKFRLCKRSAPLASWGPHQLEPKLLNSDYHSHCHYELRYGKVRAVLF